MDELSKSPIENINGIEYLFQSDRYRNELYYDIWPEYKDSNGNDVGRPYEFSKMFFSELKFYKNGDLIITNHSFKHKFPLIFYKTEYFKVRLSQEILNLISEMKWE